MFGPHIPYGVPRVIEDLIRAAWLDGLRTGLFVGVLLGAFAAVLLLGIWRQKQSN